MNTIEPIGSNTPEPNHLENLESVDFIREQIRADLAAGRTGGAVVTRFPPEPNGYLHIGHAKSICLNFGIAAEFDGGVCHLRFDDTDPSKEETEYIDSIRRDVRWLGFSWGDNLYYASDYFERLYSSALELIKRGKAYVCSLSPAEIKKYRGTLTEPGKESPYRERTVEENIDLFRKMRAGEFSEGEQVLRAKIDMASPNINLRDPVIYRIKKMSHPRTGDKWCIYPMYDFAHCLSDSIEGITHSICTLEFENHRPLYDWFLDQLPVECHPRQIEFARLNLTHTILSKRKLARLVEEGLVSGWDDPRMPTISGLRRRGYTASAIRSFCRRIGVAKRDSMVDIALLEHCLRTELNQSARRVLAVLDPLRVVIENYPEDRTEELEAINNPEDSKMGTRKIPFSRVLYIERKDFREDPPKKFFRLAPGREVRLRYGFFITCREVIKDEVTGRIEEVRCTYDPATRGGYAPDGRKVRGTLHWVSAPHSVAAEVRIYNHLFASEDPAGSDNFLEDINPDSIKKLTGCRIEPGLAQARPGDRFQFERIGYFSADSRDHSAGNPVFNQTVALRDTWAKIEKARRKKRKRNRKK